MGIWGFPPGLGGKESACNVGNLGLIPGSKRSPGEGNGNPLQYSCLKNSMDMNPMLCPFKKNAILLASGTVTLYCIL